MPTEARLRRLDALFAERVLGCKVKWWQRAKGDKLEPGCRCNSNSPHGSTDGHGDMDPALAEFTCSLDAAWEGLKRHGEAFQLRCFKDGTNVAKVDSREGREYGHLSDDHPAEALVLACLRAVGCSEEELG